MPQYPDSPEMVIDPAKTYTATIETSAGTLTADPFASEVPRTVNNFVFLANEGFYSGVIFHRTISGFMIQGGDPTGTGTGGPGHHIDCEFHSELQHGHEGILSMANAGRNTGGSQFFVTLAATPWLDNKHAIFGKVSGGMDVVHAIGSTPTGPGDRPIEQVTMETVTISEADG